MGALLKTVGRSVVVGESSLGVVGACRPWGLFTRGGIGRRRGHVCAAGGVSFRLGAFDAVGDRNPVPGRAGCPRPEQRAPGRAECPRPQEAGLAGSGEQDLQDSRGGEAARLRAGLDDVEHPDVGQLGNQAVGSPV